MKRLSIILGLALVASPAAAQGLRYTLHTNMHACKNVADAGTFWKLALQNDAQAFGTLASRKVKQGECVEFAKGTELIVMDLTNFEEQPYECSRVQGDPECYWLPAFSIVHANKPKAP